MAVNLPAYERITSELQAYGARLVAVSKIKPASDIMALYKAGQRIFGENYVQELLEKQGQLPADIQWHFIGHLQSNKVKYIAPFVSMIHGVDSTKLLQEISKQGIRAQRQIDCLLQLHIAEEETKFGLDETELNSLLADYTAAPGKFAGVRVCGFMGMATNTDDVAQVSKEFHQLKALFDKVKADYFPSEDAFRELSIGMSGDYKVALEAGGTLVRIGSMLFGARF
ncbi:YggS family pyridoxal phosphate-dependent enzyme [Chitinophaga sedimenti]|uniref:YggS family pyridoxal phosphate-dependent enzyme n=1 Tax=Chitinophaga sedimenti TaxID=2033606 RepID=UPI0020033535|nr:YggS family pyridoxal phosphate-dependent enzyme [Chitinophaga sedimenti]MCK7553799.1 YggS family pyridoxal phosphate-dependent enzyme [Chitinophaga sedimenti]